MRLFVLLIVALLALHGPAAAQEPGVARPASGKVEEGFDPAARVAGSRIVGVRIGSAGNRPFDPGAVEIVEATPGRTICVRAISRDGLYWMRTPYLAESTGPTLKLAPFTDAANRLQRYAANEIAVYAFESDDEECLGAVSAVLPVVEPFRGGGARRGDTIEVLINSGNRRVAAQIEAGNGMSATEMECAPPGSSERITHDRICTVALNALPIRTGILRLNLTFDDGLMPFSDSYDIRMPGP